MSNNLITTNNISASDNTNYNLNYHLNKTVNQLLFEYVSFSNNKIGSILKNLGIIIVVNVSLSVITSVTNELIKDNTKYISEFMIKRIKSLSFNPFSFIGSIFSSFKYKSEQKYEPITIESNPNIYEMENHESFLESLNVILENSTANEIKTDCFEIEFQKKIPALFSYESSKIDYDTEYSDIKICYSELTVKISSMCKQKKIIKASNSSSDSRINFIVQMDNLTSELIKKNYFKANDFLKKDDFDKIGEITLITTSYDISILFKFFYGHDRLNVKIKISLDCIYTLTELITNIIFSNVVIKDLDKMKDTQTGKFKLMAIYNFILITTMLCNSNIKIFDFVTTKFTNLNYSSINDGFRTGVKNDPKMEELEYAKKILLFSCENNKKSLSLEIISELDRQETLRKFGNLVTSINDYVKLSKTNQPVSIFTLELKTRETISKKPNPEYTRYIETKAMLVSQKIDATEIIKTIGIQPEPELICVNTERYIESKKLNQRFASFDNLYLRKGQEKDLLNIVSTYQTDKARLMSLGITNKLGLLFYGDPGTGKTTSIITIASFFGRNLYYINFKKIKTNAELKMAFDEVNSVLNNGIVVLEDIDCMTDIVLKRTEIQKAKESIEDESSITLEYLLNILDGLLTANDSIVIMTTNHKDHLDEALIRPGRIDNSIEMKNCDSHQIANIYRRFIGREISVNILNQIAENVHSPAKIIYHLKDWIKRTTEPDEVIMSNFLNQ